ncbi:ABC transporter ATP-binding protein [Demequina litorisediminis]|nr:ABC transporter ATP-binding protein [Demequina litorisediminis]
MTDDAAISVRGLYKDFGHVRAVNGLTFEVPRGAFYGIAGPNGAGKTTALRMVIGALEPLQGEIAVDGVSVWPDPLEAKRRMGFVADNPALFDRLTGREMCEYAGLLRGMAPDEIARRTGELLRILDMDEAAGRMVADYSLGMTKRIGLAVALLHSPRVLILDEPFGSLDPVNTQVMVSMLERYRSGGGTVVFSSHVMDVVERLCDRVLVVAEGAVRAEGTVAEVRGLHANLQDAFIALVGGRDLGDEEALVALVLLRLRLAISRRAYTRWGGQFLWVAVWWALGLVGLVVGAGLVLISTLDGGLAAVVTSVAAWWFGWLLLPMTSPSLQAQSVDPERLEPYPLTVRQKVTGMLWGGLVAPTTLMTLAFAATLAALPALRWYARPAMVLGAVLFTLSCVITSKVVQAALARMAHTRRGRDLSLILAAVLSAGSYGGYMYVLNTSGSASLGALDPAAEVASWSPPGATVAWVLDVSAGRGGLALAHLAIAVGWVALMYVAWVAVLARRAKGTGQWRRTRTVRAAAGLALVRGRRAAGRGAVAASAAQMRRYLVFRHPRAAQQVVMTVVIAAFVTLSPGVQFDLESSTAVFAGFSTAILAVGLLNYDGRAFEFLVIAGAPLRSVLVGKALAVAGITGAATVAFAVATAAWHGQGERLPAALLNGAGALAYALGVGAVASVMAPMDASRRSGGRIEPVVAVFVAMFAAPGGIVVAASLMSLAGIPALAGGVIALVVGGGLGAALLHRAGGRLAARQLTVARVLLD